MYKEKPSHKWYNEGNEIACEYREITAEDDWTPATAITRETIRPTEEDFKKTIADYLTFKVGQLLRGEIQV